MFVFGTLNENTGIQKSIGTEEKVLLFDKVTMANTFFKKLTGLIFSRPLNLNEGLVLEECNSMHTFWMRFAIDVIFLDRNNIIVHFIKNLRPFRFSPIIKGAVKVLELKSGAIKHSCLKKYDTLFFSEYPEP